MIISKLLMKTNIVEHGFFNKKNGFSKGIYKSLNCGFGSKDNKKNIIKNLNYVKKKKLNQKSIIFLFHTKFIVLNFSLLQNTQKKKLLVTD